MQDLLYLSYREVLKKENKVENLEYQEIKPYLTKTYRDYQNAKKQGNIDFFFKNEDEAWEQAREKVNGEKRPTIFMEPSKIIAFTN